MEHPQDLSKAETPVDLLAGANKTAPFVQSEEGKEAERIYAQHLKTAGKVEKPKTLDDFIKNLNRSFIKKPEKREQVMSYDDGRLLFHAIAKGLGKFEYTEHNKAIIPMMVKWFIADPTGELDLEKGILLAGNKGIGKTHLFRIFHLMVSSYNLKPHQFKTFICVGLYDALKNKKITIDMLCNGNAFFDDLGRETDTAEASVKEWGNMEIPINKIIFERDRKWDLHRLITHYTTNHSPQSLEKRYGDYIYDRIRNQCNIVYNAQIESFRGK